MAHLRQRLIHDGGVERSVARDQGGSIPQGQMTDHLEAMLVSSGLILLQQGAL